MSPTGKWTPQEVVAYRIHEFRKLRGLTQKELSSMIGITQGALGHLENGSRIPKVDTLTKIARALDISPAIFFMTDDVYVFDMKKLRRKYKTRDSLTDSMYRNFQEVILFARQLGLVEK